MRIGSARKSCHGLSSSASAAASSIAYGKTAAHVMGYVDARNPERSYPPMLLRPVILRQLVAAPPLAFSIFGSLHFLPCRRTCPPVRVYAKTNLHRSPAPHSDPDGSVPHAVDVNASPAALSPNRAKKNLLPALISALRFHPPYNSPFGTSDNNPGAAPPTLVKNTSRTSVTPGQSSTTGFADLLLTHPF